MSEQSQRLSTHNLQQQRDAGLLLADQLLAALPDEYFPSSDANSSTPRCRCHLSRHSQHPKPHPNYQYSPGSNSMSYSCSSLLSFSDSTDASSSASERRRLNKDSNYKEDGNLAEATRQLSLIRREESQLRGLLADLDERLQRLGQGAGSDQARLLLSLRRMSAERLLSALASRADDKAKEVAAWRERRPTHRKSSRNNNSSDDGSSGSCSDNDVLDDF